MDDNPYCSRLGIAVPHLEQIVARPKKVKLFYLMVVALVEHGGPMTISEIAQRLIEVGAGTSVDDLELSLKRSWHGSEPVHRRPDDLYALDIASPDLDLILFITGARPPKHTRSSSNGLPVSQSNAPLPRPDELRRAVIRTVPLDRPPQAVSVLDLSRHAMSTLVGDAVQMLPQILMGFDLLVGLGIRDSLYLAGLDPNAWKLVDLRSSQKSRRLDQSRRTLRITPEMLIKATTGISQPLGDTSKMAGYLKQPGQAKLIRRLESDVKALHAFYQYGLLHGYVRLRWGFLDELLPVFWCLPEEPDLATLLNRSMRLGAPVDVVTGPAPAWDAPWKQASRGFVVDIGEWNITLRWGNECWTVARYEIQAARVIEDLAGTRTNDDSVS